MRENFNTDAIHIGEETDYFQIPLCTALVRKGVGPIHIPVDRVGVVP